LNITSSAALAVNYASMAGGRNSNTNLGIKKVIAIAGHDY
jgi:hypothetical protein